MEDVFTNGLPGAMHTFSIDEYVENGTNPFMSVSGSGVDWTETFKTIDRKTLERYAAAPTDVATMVAARDHERFDANVVPFIEWRAEAALVELARRGEES